MKRCDSVPAIRVALDCGALTAAAVFDEERMSTASTLLKKTSLRQITRKES
jgi:hypothetical protein